jgi:hypothetical protein
MFSRKSNRRKTGLCSSSLFKASAQDFGAGVSGSLRNFANPIGNRIGKSVGNPVGNPVIRRLMESAMLSVVLGSALLGRGQSFEAQAVHAQPVPMAATAQTAVPALIPYSGVLENADAKTPSGPMSMTFLIYKDEQGGEPLWAESQTIAVDEQHRYSATLGATLSKGLPDDLFSSGEARWLEVQVAGRAPQRRVLMMSVPYALKAADATTLGGLPVSAFALAGTTANLAAGQVTAEGVTPNTTTNVTTTGGASGYVPLFNGASSVIDSTLFQSGSYLGVNNTAPLATLDVNGSLLQRGQLLMYSTGAATSSAAKNSQPITFEASGYNSSTKADMTNFFTLQSETGANNTSAPYGTLHLLYGNNTTPTETGLYINNNGTIHFAAGQTFQTNSPNGAIAVDGVSTTGYGVEGDSTSNAGILGTSTSGSGIIGSTVGGTLHTAGVYGSATSPNISGFNGIAGVWGDSNAHVGVFGSSTQAPGVFGESLSSYGVQAQSFNSYGIYGQTNTSTAGIAAIYGYSAGSTVGVKGASASGNGGEFYGGANSVGGNGVLAVGGAGSGSASFGGDGGNFTGATGGENGGNGLKAYGGQGPDSGGNGIIATGGTSGDLAGSGGVFYGSSSSTGVGGDGVFAVSGSGSNTNDNGLAGYFYGNVSIDGTLVAETKYFQIDHPGDPANKFLNHASVESSEMMNIYSGNVTTDELGLATVTLPGWFEQLNGDFRYQLTIVGRKASAWISKEIAGGKFQIASDATNAKVSWQVTGVRQDAYAKAHPLVVEQAKNNKQRGLYKHPELYGQPATKGLAVNRHPKPVEVPVTGGKAVGSAAVASR